MKFSEFKVGQTLEFGPVTITEAEILAFARHYDPQWFHTNPARASGSRWKGLIASGWQTGAIAMRLVVQGALEGSEAFGSPGLEYLKWLHPVRPGDSLRVAAEVLEVRRSHREPTLGILRWRWLVMNQRNVVALDLVATSFFDLAPGS
jgi:acyl dehydratase